MPVPPYPSVPAPITWRTGQQILTGNLRADISNAATLLANKPMFVGSQVSAFQGMTAGISNLIKSDTDNSDPWGMHQIPASTISVRFPGWYLCDGYTEGGSIAATATMSTGFRATQNGVVADQLGGCGPGNGTNDQGYPGAALVQLDPATGDSCAMIATPSAGCNVSQAEVKAEWVALPTTLGYATGTVVTSPQPASPWPFGTTTITNVGGIAAGATSMTVADPTGMVVGGMLGLDYTKGAAAVPTAETVTITSVAGSTIGITATTYPHGGTASPGYVAVPVSAAFLNQQARDMINFLCYPPIFSAFYDSGSTSIPNQTFPSNTQVPLNSGTVVDNFSGWSAATGRYTFPVSGAYYVYGQVSMAAAANYTAAAGIGISGGAINWGTTYRNTSGTSLAMTATVRRVMRVTAGQYVSLFTSQNSGGGLALSTAGFKQASKLIVVFRSF